MKIKTIRKAAKCAFAVSAAAAGALFVIAPGFCTERQKQPFLGRYFAHRGLHTPDRSVPENSLAAFRLAAEAGYGIELDVQLSKDGQVVVFHDDDLKRVCGLDKRVDELTYDELLGLSLCGTEEKIPLFTQVLEVIAGKGPLIVELKNGKRNRELCEKTNRILSTYKGDVCIESFNPLIVAWFRLHAPDLVRGQLACPAEEYKMKKTVSFLLSHCLMNALARPQFIAYKIGKRPLCVKLSEKLGAMRVGWTSRNPGDEKKRDGVIFEFYRPELTFTRRK